MNTDGTLKEDLLAAFRKERDRLDAIPIGKMTAEDEARYSHCVEYIKLLNQSGDDRRCILTISAWWTHPFRV